MSIKYNENLNSPEAKREMGRKLPLEAESTVLGSTAKSKGHTYRRLLIYIPQKLSQDSAFPLKEGDKIKIRIESGKLVIEKAD